MATKQKDAGVIPRLPHYFNSAEGKAIPAGLVGATIVRIGTVSESQSIEGGGLVIDYQLARSKTIRRIVLAFNELGMWVYSRGPATASKMD